MTQPSSFTDPPAGYGECRVCDGPKDAEGACIWHLQVYQLYEAVRSLTVMGRDTDGALIIGPQGWAMLQRAISRFEGW